MGDPAASTSSNRMNPDRVRRRDWRYDVDTFVSITEEACFRFAKAASPPVNVPVHVVAAILPVLD
jgi:hypothetical protein